MINWITATGERRGDDPVVVVDGGATHCRVAVVATDGHLLAFATGEPTNARSVGSEQAAANLAATLADALDRAGDAVDPAAITYGLVTSAAVDTQVQADNLSHAVAPLLPRATVHTVPDTMGCWAATNGLGPGVAVISGTGSVVVAADRDRRLWRRFGGWDFLLGDEGSGYSLGRAALQATLLVHEGRSDATALSAAVLQSDPAHDPDHTIAEPDDIPDAVHHPSIDKAWIASFAPLVLGLADAGDAPSLAIVRREVGILADAAAAGIAVLRADAQADDEGDAVAVGLFGGTFNSAALRDAFVAAVADRVEHPFAAAVPAHSALVGAFAMALGADPSVAGPRITAAADALAADLAAGPPAHPA